VAPIDDALLCAEVGYAVSALLLAVLLSGIYRRPADAGAASA
jgi:hypothetical protein